MSIYFLSKANSRIHVRLALTDQSGSVGRAMSNDRCNALFARCLDLDTYDTALHFIHVESANTNFAVCGIRKLCKPCSSFSNSPMESVSDPPQASPIVVSKLSVHFSIS